MSESRIAIAGVVGTLSAAPLAIAALVPTHRDVRTLGLVVGLALVLLAVALITPDLWTFARDGCQRFLAKRQERRAARDLMRQPIGWRHTANGIEAPAAMRTLQMRSNHLGYPAMGGLAEVPMVQVAVLVPIRNGLGAAIATTELKARMVEFLEQPVFMRLLAQTTHVESVQRWQTFGGHGRQLHEAVFGEATQETMPTATAMLLFPDDPPSGQLLSPSYVRLLVRIDPRGSDGNPRTPRPLADWRGWLSELVNLPLALQAWLATLGVACVDEPSSQFAIALESQRGLSQLVDSSPAARIPNTNEGRHWLAYFINTRGGPSITTAVNECLTLLCDSGLHVQGYEPLLAHETDPRAIESDEAGSGPSALAPHA